MERSEPTLVPEWLKKTGTVGSGSASHSDRPAASDLLRSKSFANSNSDFGGSSSSAKATSSYFHRSSSSNGFGGQRSRSNFGRNRHPREYDRNNTNDKLDKNSRDRRFRDFSDGRGDNLHNEFERVSGKCGSTWHRKVIAESSSNSNGLPSKGNSIGQVSKVTFEREFPSLGAEEKSVGSEVGRVPSPGLSSAVQGLPIGSSAINSDETLTSVLAGVPVSVGSTGTGMSSTQQVAQSGVMHVAVGTPSNLNMAEAVIQGPKCTQIIPQVSVETQRLEELAIKQSRQLIPVTPSMPKPLVFSSLDKQKTKVGQQQHPVSSSFVVNHPIQRTNTTVKIDVLKPSNMGKLQVLKPVREKNAADPVKDNLSPRNGARLVNSISKLASVSTAPTCAAQSHESKPASNLPEKRPSPQVQSRNDFFNSVRKKSMANSSSAVDSSVSISSSDPDSNNSDTTVTASVSDNIAEANAVSAPNTSQSHSGSDNINSGGNTTEAACLTNLNGNDDTCSGQKKHVKTGDKIPTSDPIFSEEEEAAFLRSLGWEENADEDGLTEEEINAFFRDVAKYINSKPSLKIPPRVDPEFLVPFKPHIVGIRPSNAKLES
ncbi:uncharacterized protein LOC127261314 [Andrographis paniculata]|uniref:uncharacterized protein LOC127261314 n=1 Tax=Andrographis paniculata TaxID=175694 RepID=UPI0021E7976A|nr:uncharacterized protein LOC127261314 [Andrographis paniculata]